MHIKRTTFLIAILAAFAATTQAELVFEKTELELRPKVGEATVAGSFKYKNKGEKPIAIKSVTSTCGCTAASAKNSAAPGEEGEVKATFTIGNRTGVQQKNITVTTDDPAKPTTTLTLKVVIPQLLELKPTFVHWQPGEPAKAKTISAKAEKDIAVKSLDISSSSPEFVTKVEPGPAAGEFQINVEPRQTEKPATATLTIKPNVENGPSKPFYVVARVMGQTPAAGQPGAAVPNQPNQPVQARAMAGAQSKGKIDACTLLTSKEIETIQGEPLKETKPSGKSSGGLAVSQCYFALPTSSNSINLVVMQKGDEPGPQNPKQHWKEMFHRETQADQKSEPAEQKEGEKKRGPEKIAGLGDEAFWMGNRVGGVLCVLKGDSYISITVGGAGEPAAKIKKSTDLAQLVLKRL